MAMTLVLLICILPILIIIYEISRRRRYSALPPGPIPISLLGNITAFLTDSRPKHEILAELGKKYGDVMTVWFLTKPVIMLSSLEAVRKAYVEKQNDFASRPDTILSMIFFDGFDLDVAFGRYSKRWQLRRKLLHGSIRQLAASKHLENETAASLEQVIEKMLLEGAEQPIDMRQYVLRSVYNMVMILVFGKRFDLDDPEFLQFYNMHHVDDEAISATRLYDSIPFLQRIPMLESISPTLRRTKRVLRLRRSYLWKWFEEADYEDGEIEYMTQAFKKGVDAVENKERETGEDDDQQPINGSADNSNNRQQRFGDKEIMAMMMDLYLGSTSTTTSAISWLFLELVLHPDIQDKCYNEILQVVGSSERVSISDRPKLPYIEACILETLRFHSPVSLNLPHTPPEDTNLGDYKIPAGTDTIVNIWAIHHDPKLWKDADNFNPDNFLDSAGQLLRPPQFLPFGAGRRVCVGEAFAKNSLFLTVTMMLQRLRFERVRGREYTLERSVVSGEFINVPQSYVVSIRPR